MDIEKLRELEENIDGMAKWVSHRIELETVPNLIIPDWAGNREEYRIHIDNMIGSYRILLGQSYNAIPGWQNV